MGRIYTYDPTGGRYEETDFHADGSGGRDARTTIKLGWQAGPRPRATPSSLAVRALWQAADEDSATGGPDAVRGIYPTVATITAAGFEPADEAEVAERFAGGRRRQRRGAGHEHALLRRARAVHEGQGGLRPQEHRPGPTAGGHGVRRAAS